MQLVWAVDEGRSVQTFEKGGQQVTGASTIETTNRDTPPGTASSADRLRAGR